MNLRGSFPGLVDKSPGTGVRKENQADRDSGAAVQGIRSGFRV